MAAPVTVPTHATNSVLPSADWNDAANGINFMANKPQGNIILSGAGAYNPGAWTSIGYNSVQYTLNGMTSFNTGTGDGIALVTPYAGLYQITVSFQFGGTFTSFGNGIGIMWNTGSFPNPSTQLNATQSLTPALAGIGATVCEAIRLPANAYVAGAVIADAGGVVASANNGAANFINMYWVSN